MNYIRGIISVAVCCFLMLVSKTSFGQARVYDTTTANIMQEFLNVQSALSDTGYLSFDASYYLQDIDTVTVRDTISAKYKINGDSLYVQLLKDTIENIQNVNYAVTVYHTNRAIVVQKPTTLTKQVFQVDVMDSVFQNAAMTGMTAADSGTSFRKLTILFDSNAIYKSYQLVYNKTTNRILYLKYALKKELCSCSGKSVNMYIAFSNYQTGTFTNSVFSTDALFTVNSPADIQLATGMDPSYEIINLIVP